MLANIQFYLLFLPTNAIPFIDNVCYLQLVSEFPLYFCIVNLFINLILNNDEKFNCIF